MEFEIYLNFSSKCNLRCSYCFENFNKKTKLLDSQTLNKIIEKIDLLLENKEFIKKFNIIKINLFGGEPTLNIKNLKKLINHYKYNEKVNFFIFSNGYDLNNLYDFFSEINSINYEKMGIQISYDGISQNKDRKTLNGKETALKVKETIFKLNAKKINFTVHPTLTFNNLDCLYDNFYEFLKMSKIIKSIVDFSPDLDKEIFQNMDEEKFNIFKEKYIKQMKLIKNLEKEYYRKNNKFFLEFLNLEGIKTCGFGKMMMGIDLDGNIYPCHSVFFNDELKKDLILNNIYNDDNEFIKNFFNNQEKFSKIRDMKNQECEKCDIRYCKICKIEKFKYSKKETFDEKIKDFQSQEYACKIYKFISNVSRALIETILKEINN